MEASGHASGGTWPTTARELQAIIHAEREATPFLVYRLDQGEQRIFPIGPDRGELTVGRSAEADVSLAWDDEVSAVHAVLEQLVGELALVDDGLSRNGSYVNGERVRGRRRLRDGDLLRFGQTVIHFHSPTDADRRETFSRPQASIMAELSTQQRKVLVALCRPLRAGNAFVAPATNQDIANELYLSVDAVKAHLRVLFDKFAIGDLPHNKKRLALAASALQSGLLVEP
jgi:FHA domain